VLLVDDDLVFARALRRALNPHDVRVCGSAAEAEIALMEPGYEPDMVICDLELPGAHGRVLHERISLSQPGIAPRFVFVSGSPVRFEDTTYFASTGCPSLAKPLVVADLMALLESDEGPRTQSFIDQNRELE
jgi:CheY-like chemotaxis protein